MEQVVTPWGGDNSSSSDSPYGNKTPGGIDYVGRYDIPISRYTPYVEGYNFAGYLNEGVVGVVPTEVFWKEGMAAGGSSGNETVTIYTRAFQSNLEPSLICTMDSESYYGLSDGVNGRKNINNVVTYNDKIYLVWVVSAYGGTGNTIPNKNWRVGVFSITAEGSYSSVAHWLGSADDVWWWYGALPRVNVGLYNSILSIIVAPNCDIIRNDDYQVRLHKVNLDTGDKVVGILRELKTSQIVPTVSTEFSFSGLAASADIFAVYDVYSLSTNPIFTSTSGGMGGTAVLKSIAHHGFLFQSADSESSYFCIITDTGSGFTVSEGVKVSGQVQTYFSSKGILSASGSWLWYAVCVDNVVSKDLFVTRELSVGDLQTGKTIASTAYMCKYLTLQTATAQNKLYICVDRGDGTEDRYLVNA